MIRSSTMCCRRTRRSIPEFRRAAHQHSRATRRHQHGDSVRGAGHRLRDSGQRAWPIFSRRGSRPRSAPGSGSGCGSSARKGRLSLPTCKPDSPAAKAGAQKDDQIVTVDGQNIRDVLRLQRMLIHKKAGDVVQFDIERSGEARLAFR